MMWTPMDTSPSLIDDVAEGFDVMNQYATPSPRSRFALISPRCYSSMAIQVWVPCMGISWSKG